MDYREKMFRAETKVLDEGSGRVEAVVSDESEDRDGDIIRQAGWDLASFQRHPVLLASHNYGSLRAQIGEWESMEVKGKQLVGVAHYYIGQGNEEADWGFQLAARQRAAYSVGFIPLEWEEREVENGDDRMWPPYEFKRQELLETSHVTIPSNRNALQTLAKSGLRLHPIVAELLDECGAACEPSNLEQLVNRTAELVIVRLPKLFAWAAAPIADKGAIASHSTPTDTESSWDGPSEVAAMPAEARVLRAKHAWINPDADADTKAAYKFPHHPANSTKAIIAGVNNALARLSQANIPGADRAGVEAHLRRHRRDAGLEEEGAIVPAALLAAINEGIEQALKEVQHATRA